VAGAAAGDELRPVVLTSAAIGSLALAVPVLLFGAVLDGTRSQGCASGLPANAYGDALVPVHVASAAVLWVTAAWLAARRAPDGRVPPRTIGVLAGIAAVGAAAFVSDAVAVVVCAAAMLLLFPLCLVLAVQGVTRAIASWRRRRAAERSPASWPDRAAVVQSTVWVLLLVGVPASAGWAYLNAASLFCF
jgi:hypothetical protein